MNNGRIYLSGSMQHAPDGELGAKWRLDATPRLEALGFTPLDITKYDVSYTEAHTADLKCSVHEGMTDEELLQTKSNIRKHFVSADLNLITFWADAMIIRYDEGVRKGAGTISECQHAYNLDIPIFLVNEYKILSEVPGWLAALTTKIFDQWQAMYSYLGDLPQGILKRDVYGNRRSGSHYLCSLCGTVEQKHKAHFVSKISPLYCKSCVELVKTTFEEHKDRYQFFLEHLEGTDQQVETRTPYVR